MAGRRICAGIIFLLLLSSCGTQKKDIKQKSVRLVDSKGNPVSLNRRVPKFNQAQISKQKMSNPNVMIMNGNSDYNQNSLPKNLFADKAIQKEVVVEKTANDAVIFKATEQEKKLKQELVRKKEGVVKKTASVKTKKEVVKKTENRASVGKQTKKKIVATTPVTQKNVNKVKTKTRTTSSRGTFYIQIGAYREKRNANRSLNKYSNIGKGLVKNYKNKSGIVIYRAVLGPYSSRSRAEIDLEKVIQRGHYDVYITRR